MIRLANRLVASASFVAVGALGLAGCTQPPVPPAGDGCAKPATEVVDQQKKITVAGQGERSYTWTASGTAGPKALVIDFHGLFEGTVGVHPTMTQFSPKALAEGFVVAYPVGEGGGLNWDLNADGPSLAYIDRLLAQLRSDACIDIKRVYATGLSYGGFMSSAIMCHRSTVFAAAAPVAGLQNLCGTVPRKVPVVTFHGTADPILAYSSYGPTPQAIATRYGCGAKTTTTVVAEDPVTKGPITKDTWDCAAQGTAVESYVVGGGGHGWPGSEFSASIGGIVGPTPTSIDATDIIWDFFERFSL